MAFSGDRGLEQGRHVLLHRPQWQHTSSPVVAPASPLPLHRWHHRSPTVLLDPTSGGVALGWAWRASSMGSAGSIDGIAGFFLFFYVINRGGHQTASKKISLTVTFDPRRLAKTSQLIFFARLG